MDDDAWLGRFFYREGQSEEEGGGTKTLVAQQQEQALSFCGGGGGPTSFGSNEAGPNALDVWDCE